MEWQDLKGREVVFGICLKKLEKTMKRNSYSNLW